MKKLKNTAFSFLAPTIDPHMWHRDIANSRRACKDEWAKASLWKNTAQTARNTIDDVTQKLNATGVTWQISDGPIAKTVCQDVF